MAAALKLLGAEAFSGGTDSIVGVQFGRTRPTPTTVALTPIVVGGNGWSADVVESAVCGVGFHEVDRGDARQRLPKVNQYPILSSLIWDV